MKTINASFNTTGNTKPVEYHHVQQGNEGPPHGTMWGLVNGDVIRVKRQTGIVDSDPFAVTIGLDNESAQTLTHVGNDGVTKAITTYAAGGASHSFTNVEVGDHFTVS